MRIQGLKLTAEGLGRLAGEQRRQIVDRNDGHGRAALETLDGDGRAVEGGRHSVNGDRGEGGGGVLHSIEQL